VPLFGSKSPAFTLSQGEFMTRVQALASYKLYTGKAGTALAHGLALALWDEECRRRDAEGFYAPGKDISRFLPVPVNATIAFKSDADRTGLIRRIDLLLEQDLRQIAGREAYLNDLAGRAKGGQLRAGLNTNVDPESGYYTAPPASQWSDMSVQAKAKAWLTFQKNAGAAPLVDTYAKSVGWPLGQDTTAIKDIWKALVSDAPAYRTVNIGGVKYPSSFGGMFLLQQIMAGFAARPAPARGNPAWEDWALYVFGAVMTSQPFTDGNKRASRAAYAIMIVSGGVDFRAMNSTYGASLGPM
jgi:hypothetical protein